MHYGRPSSVLYRVPPSAREYSFSLGRSSAAALARSPALRGAEASRQAVRGDALQAPLRPNPEATLLGENFGGIGGRGVRVDVVDTDR